MLLRDIVEMLLDIIQTILKQDFKKETEITIEIWTFLKKK